jgi:hypothetical protein
MAFLLVTGMAIILLAAGGAVMAVWLIGKRAGERDTLSQVQNLANSPRRMQPMRVLWFGENGPAGATYRQEELPF